MSTNSHFVGAAAVQMPNTLIIDETRQYLEMILSGITEYCEYNYKNHLWQLTLDNDLIDAITEHTLISETLSDTIIRASACDWASNPTKTGRRTRDLSGRTKRSASQPRPKIFH